MTSEQQERTVRILTLVLAGVWAATLVVRIYQPGWPVGPAADSLMLSVTGYWFAKEGLAKKEKAA